MKKKVIHIGTRESRLAEWQARQVAALLLEQGVESKIVFIKSEGDLNLTQPLYEMGVQGIFTKALDIALLNSEIDMAVHSYKDVPVQPAKDLEIATVLKRDNPFDTLMINPFLMMNKNRLQAISTGQPLCDDDLTIVGTSSLRRKAQWLNLFPQSQIENLRGNVNTRIKKLENSLWHAALFAAAGLERLNLYSSNCIQLNWMLPAPAQGAISVMCREADNEIKYLCHILNDTDTEICTYAEKQFLKVLMGGCSMPIAALATISGNEIHFKGNILSVDGKEKVSVQITDSVSAYKNIGAKAAQEIINKGGDKILRLFNKSVCCW